MGLTEQTWTPVGLMCGTLPSGIICHQRGPLVSGISLARQRSSLRRSLWICTCEVLCVIFVIYVKMKLRLTFLVCNLLSHWLWHVLKRYSLDPLLLMFSEVAWTCIANWATIYEIHATTKIVVYEFRTTKRTLTCSSPANRVNTVWASGMPARFSISRWGACHSNCGWGSWSACRKFSTP